MAANDPVNSSDETDKSGLALNCPECGSPPPHTRVEATANHPVLVECGVYAEGTGCGATWWLDQSSREVER